MPREAINVDGGAPVGGPYTPVVKAGDFIYISGQVPIHPTDGAMPDAPFSKQVELCLDNVKRLVEGAGASMDDVVKTLCFLADMDRFHDFNDVYVNYFSEPRPARSCIQAGRLPFDFQVEVEAIVYVGK